MPKGCGQGVISGESASFSVLSPLLVDEAVPLQASLPPTYLLVTHKDNLSCSSQGWLLGIHVDLQRHLHLPCEPTASGQAPWAGGVHTGRLLGATRDLNPQGNEGHTMR